jgi:SAM-dependent methyltransferase
MHKSAYDSGAEFFKQYWREGFQRILDVGSTNVNGTLRDFCPEGAEFTGVDLAPGPSVDVVLKDPYQLPFPDGRFDFVISTSCFEHDEMFWLTFLECCRVVSNRGFIYINAPSSGIYHGYPGDQWRFYPDASLALAKWARRMQHPIDVVESFVTSVSPTHFNDYVMVFTKDPTFMPTRFLADIVAGATQIRKPPRLAEGKGEAERTALAPETETSETKAPETKAPETWPAQLKRSDVLNSILSLFDKPRYLEIGVHDGGTFFAVKADAKVAVDPQFLFDVDGAKLKHPSAQFHSVESDAYFGGVIAADERFDVIYLDGLHTVEQTLRDFCNAIEFLKEGGVIVIDDVVPNSYHASLPDRAVTRQVRDKLYPGDKDDSWMGDVYRLLFFIQTFFQQYRYATVIENHGQLVVWKDRRGSKDLARRGLGAIGSLPFEKTITESDAYNKLPFPEIMALLRGR